ncbi:MAG: TonB-dependent receptor [Pseudomonadales bacterium]
MQLTTTYLRKVAGTAGCIANVLLLSCWAHADGDSFIDDQRALVETVVVVATRQPSEQLRLPYTTHVIQHQAAVEAQYRTLPQLLRDFPGVMVQETAFGQGSPYVRGMTGFRNLMLIDGIRINNSAFRDGPNQYWSTVDALGLDRVEMVKGPTSTLYGSDAIGATVNAVTLDPFLARSEMLMRVASAEESVSGRAQFGTTLSDRFGLAAGITGKSYGDLEGGSQVGTQRGVGYDEQGVDIKAAWLAPGGWRVDGFTSELRQNNVPRTHSTIAGVSWHGTTVGSDLRRELDQQRSLSYLKLTHSDLVGMVKVAEFTASYAQTKEVEDRIRGSGRWDKQGFDLATSGLLAQFRSDSPIGSLTYGIDYYHDSVDSYSSRNPVQGPVADDASYRTIDLYLQNRVSLSTSVELLAGIRRTWIGTDTDSVLDPQTGEVLGINDSWSSTVGSLGVNWAVQPDRLAVFANLSQGFRAPNLSDLTRFDSARSNEVETPAPGLEPEHFLTAEVGMRLRGEQSRLEISVFTTGMDDLIQRVPTGNQLDGEYEITKTNAGDGRVDGVEISWTVFVTPTFELFGQMAWLDGTVGTFPTSEPIRVDEAIDRMMPLNGSIGLRWTPAESRYWLECQFVAADGQSDLSTRDQEDTSRIPPGGTPGYGVMHLRGGYRISETLRVFGALENVTNRDYRVHGSGTNMPGRNFIVSLQAIL